MQQAVAANPPVKADYIQRFNIRQRVEHYILMVVFTVLAITGLIQRYYTVGVCQWLIQHLGGYTAAWGFSSRHWWCTA